MTGVFALRTRITGRLVSPTTTSTGLSALPTLMTSTHGDFATGGAALATTGASFGAQPAMYAQAAMAGTMQRVCNRRETLLQFSL
jgi:hypothetical protein